VLLYIEDVEVFKNTTISFYDLHYNKNSKNTLSHFLSIFKDLIFCFIFSLCIFFIAFSVL